MYRVLLAGKGGQVARSTCWYVRDGCSCDYTYGDAIRVSSTRRESSQFKLLMEDLTATVFSLLAPSLGSSTRRLELKADVSLKGIRWWPSKKLLVGCIITEGYGVSTLLQ